MLDAAARLFGSRHFHEVRMDDLAAAAEVGKGTLYRYFRDKEELFLALLKRASEQLSDRLQAVDPARPAQDRLTALVEAVVTFFDEQPHVFDLIQRAEVLGGLRETWQPVREGMQHRVRELFAEGRARGEFAVADPETAALVLLGGVRSVVRYGTRPRPGGLARRIVESVLFGAAAPAVEPVA
jgi:AcrR family transcriptional regulator